MHEYRYLQVSWISFQAAGVNKDCTDERLQPSTSGGGCSSSMAIDSNLISRCRSFKSFIASSEIENNSWTFCISINVKSSH